MTGTEDSRPDTVETSAAGAGGTVDPASTASGAGPTVPPESAGPGSPAAPVEPASTKAPPALLPVYLVVLVLTAVVAVGLAAHGAATYHEAAAEKAFPPETRRAIIFPLVFNVAVGAALVVACLAELALAAARLARRRPAGRVLARAGLGLVPLLVLAAGHWVVNPWLPDLLDQLRRLGG